MIPNILLCHRHSPMNVGLFLRYAFKKAGCRVRTMGPVIDTVYNHAFPSEDWERPDFLLSNNDPLDVAVAIELAAAGGFKPDAAVMVDQFDDFYLTGECNIPWAWIAVENWNAQQQSRFQMRRGAVEYHMISHFKDNDVAPPPGSEFLPFGFDEQIHPLLGMQRDKVVAQIGTHYEPRPHVWNGLRSALDNAPALDAEVYGSGLQETERTLFGKVFSYQGLAEAYNRAVITISASNCDFLPMRIFEAMAMGCVLVSDDQPILREWIGPPSDPPNLTLWFAHDGSPDGIAETVMNVSRLDQATLGYVSSQSFTLAMARHTYTQRARRVLQRLGLRGACRVVTD